MKLSNFSFKPDKEDPLKFQYDPSSLSLTTTSSVSTSLGLFNLITSLPSPNTIYSEIAVSAYFTSLVPDISELNKAQLLKGGATVAAVGAIQVLPPVVSQSLGTVASVLSLNKGFYDIKNGVILARNPTSRGQTGEWEKILQTIKIYLNKAIPFQIIWDVDSNFNGGNQRYLIQSVSISVEKIFENTLTLEEDFLTAIFKLDLKLIQRGVGIKIG